MRELFFFHHHDGNIRKLIEASERRSEVREKKRMKELLITVSSGPEQDSFGFDLVQKKNMKIRDTLS